MVNSLSVIVPVYNSAAMLDRCLAAVARSLTAPLEVIVVDDGSTDGSADVALRHGVRLLRQPCNAGPAAARNAAARQALGDVFVFIDADVEVHPDALQIISRRLGDDSGLDAVIGSYDDQPSDPGLVSTFRNLLHSYVHHDAPLVINSFWAGCGAIRRSAFEAVGGFDESYITCSTEDVELGIRLTQQRYRIEIDSSIEARHLKRWTLRSMVQTDVFQRAIPFAELMIREQTYPRVLGFKQLASALILVLVMPWIAELSWYAFALGGAGYVLLNAGFLRFHARRCGVPSAAVGLCLLCLHHLSGATGVALGTVRYFWGNRRAETVFVGAAMLVLVVAAAGWGLLNG